MSEKIQELFKLKLAGALSQQRNEIIKPIETSETTELLRTEFLTRQAFRDAYRRAVENKSSLEKIYQKWDDYQKACREVPEDFRLVFEKDNWSEIRGEEVRTLTYAG